MIPLLDRVRRYAAQLQLWSPATRIVAGVSGGSDSVALLFLLRDLAARHEIVLAGVAHLDHRLRGDAAAADAAFCRDLAARLGIPAVIGEADVAVRAAADGVSLEVAARHARHQFLQGALTPLGGDRVALAHTQDDQAETVLLRLVRGAGTAGLAGIPPARDHLVRPLLTVTRRDLRQYLSDMGESWREDATNADRAHPRNRMRHEVLPLLRKHFNPRIDTALARTADILRADAGFLDEQATAAAERVLVSSDGRVAIDAAALASLPAALSRRVALRALETANPSRSYGLKEADAVCDVVTGSPPADLAGVRMERSGATVVLEKRAPCRPRAPGPVGVELELPLPVPGSVSSGDSAWTMVAEGPVPRPSRLKVEPGRVVVDADRLVTPLVVRSRRHGDWLRPLGLAGRKKVQDLLVDRKVPSLERDLVPIVTDTTGSIVWVAGHALADPFRVTPATTTVVILTLRRQ